MSAAIFILRERFEGYPLVDEGEITGFVHSLAWPTAILGGITLIASLAAMSFVAFNGERMRQIFTLPTRQGPWKGLCANAVLDEVESWISGAVAALDALSVFTFFLIKLSLLSLLPLVVGHVAYATWRIVGKDSWDTVRKEEELLRALGQ